MHRLAAALLLALATAACGDPAGSAAGGGADTTLGAAWAYHGQVAGVLPDRAAAAVVEDADAWEAAWSDHGFDGPLPAVDFDHHVVLLLGQADDACPDDLIGLQVVEARLEVEWLPPPGGCVDLLMMRIHAVTVHRGHLTEQFTYGLDEPFDDELVPVTINLPPYDGTAPPPPTPPAAMGDDELDAVFAGHPVQRCGPEHEFPRRGGQVDGPLSDDPEVAAAQEARAGFGVASDEPTVRALLEDPPQASGVEDYGFPLTAEEFELDRAASDTAGRVAEWLEAQGYGDRQAVPMVDRSDGIRPAVVAGERDADRLRAALDEAFGDGVVHVHVSPWDPADVVAAQDALTRRMAEVDAHATVTWISGPPGPAQIGLIDPTRQALDAIAAIVDPSLVCVSVELTGVRPLPAR